MKKRAADDTELKAEAKRMKLAAVEKLAYSPEELAAALGIGRSRVYDAIAKGELRANKYGRRTLIFKTEVLRWMATFPVLDLNA